MDIFRREELLVQNNSSNRSMDYTPPVPGFAQNSSTNRSTDPPPAVSASSIVVNRTMRYKESARGPNLESVNAIVTQDSIYCASNRIDVSSCCHGDVERASAGGGGGGNGGTGISNERDAAFNRTTVSTGSVAMEIVASVLNARRNSAAAGLIARNGASADTNIPYLYQHPQSHQYLINADDRGQSESDGEGEDTPLLRPKKTAR